MFYMFMLYLLIGVVLTTLLVKNVEDNKEEFREFKVMIYCCIITLNSKVFTFLS